MVVDYFFVLVRPLSDRFVGVTDEGWIITTSEVEDAYHFKSRAAIQDFMEEKELALSNLSDHFRIEEYSSMQVSGTRNQDK